MSTGPSPHGQNIGLVECVFKSPVVNGLVFVSFKGTDGLQGYAGFFLTEEDAKYFIVGKKYSNHFWRP